MKKIWGVVRNGSGVPPVVTTVENPVYTAPYVYWFGTRSEAEAFMAKLPVICAMLVEAHGMLIPLPAVAPPPKWEEAE